MKIFWWSIERDGLEPVLYRAENIHERMHWSSIVTPNDAIMQDMLDGGYIEVSGRTAEMLGFPA